MEKQNIIKEKDNNKCNFNSSYRRSNSVENKKSIHCIDALEDILDSLLDKHAIRVEYYHTEHVVILKFNSRSYRFSTPISNDDIVFFVKEISISKNLDKEKLLDNILNSTNVGNIVKDHCFNCYKINKCNAYNKHLTL